MINLILIAFAPVILILFYVYYRDKYEKEPIGKLLLSVLFGALAVIPILITETILSFPASWMDGYLLAGWDAFVVAAFSEESFKFLVFIIFIWRSKHFNEHFDGIVYAVYISLGFALVENILYVVEGGASTALVRAISAVPAHAIFGVTMGYYLGRAKFDPAHRRRLILTAIFLPILLHGLYDFILMSGMPYFLIFFAVYLFVLYRLALKRMKQLSVLSGYRMNKVDEFNNNNSATGNTQETTETDESNPVS
ncbi:MAG TPA: PrsW family glutamic-type intramembrane protease [Bacteroidales bacterium]|nr:PrsW family glutamic-type intramembrane protease [Bacteroidales bacterium]HQP03639.1 PrsW family glutamic-type intramembrane protease [Bacteroidales bacterium]